jgi:hypothetical protein
MEMENVIVTAVITSIIVFMQVEIVLQARRLVTKSQHHHSWRRAVVTEAKHLVLISSRSHDLGMCCITYITYSAFDYM